MSDKSKYTKMIKAKASELGFFHCGISKADFLEEEAPRLEFWLKNNFNGKMTYMENYFDKRLDPRLLVEDSKSVVSLLFNYYTEEKQIDPAAPKISKYAFGEDYHQVIKDKLHEFYAFIGKEIGEVHGRVFVDSAPVMDKAWAKKSGLGWIGKNTNLIHPKKGSFFFIAELILDLELEPDGPIKDYCGTCTKCIDACPTEAIVQPYMVDGSKCISYLTIELKDALLPTEFNGKMDNWAFGCDVCQDVCPWNRFSVLSTEKRFEANQRMLQMTRKDWEEMTEDFYKEVLKNSPLNRRGYDGIKRNVVFLTKS